MTDRMLRPFSCILLLHWLIITSTSQFSFSRPFSYIAPLGFWFPRTLPLLFFLVSFPLLLLSSLLHFFRTHLFSAFASASSNLVLITFNKFDAALSAMEVPRGAAALLPGCFLRVCLLRGCFPQGNLPRSGSPGESVKGLSQSWSGAVQRIRHTLRGSVV
jgi:hypothetical protein